MENQKYFMFLYEIENMGVNKDFLKSLLTEFTEITEEQAQTILIQYKFSQIN